MYSGFIRCDWPSAAKTNILFIRAHELIKDNFNKPWILKYNESYNTRVDARKRERYLKTAAGRKYLKYNIFNT